MELTLRATREHHAGVAPVGVIPSRRRALVAISAGFAGLLLACSGTHGTAQVPLTTSDAGCHAQLAAGCDGAAATRGSLAA